MQSLLRPLLRFPRPLWFPLLHPWWNRPLHRWLNRPLPLWNRQHCKRCPRRLQRLKMSA